jgi:hypothetical protein
MADPPEDSGEDVVTQDELDQLAHKIRAWAETLPPREQALLQLVLAQAKREELEVQGFGTEFGPSFKPLVLPAVQGTFEARSGAYWVCNWNRSDPD